MFVPLMLDSGAYSAARQNDPIDIEAYIEFVKKVNKRTPEAICINLDVLNEGQASYDNWIRMREAGVDVVPVYHAATDIKFLEMYLAEGIDYIAIGDIAGIPSGRRTLFLDRVWDQYLTDADGYPKLKVHGMGMTDFKLMKRYPWYSVDSTSWLLLAIYGKVLVPRFEKGEPVWDDTPMTIVFSSKSPAKSELGKHYETMSEVEREILLRYLDLVGMPLGKSEFFRGEEKVIERGVTNDYVCRAIANAYFYGKFADACTTERFDKTLIQRGLVW